ncbi:MAG: hypothetical protein GY862_28355 [Gammaproteobacteria bacterium]|nr:hypothetical protein [Gammaproteobacteria bacterium]
MNSKTGHPVVISGHLPQSTGKIPIILGGLALLGPALSGSVQAACTCPNPQSAVYLAGNHLDDFAPPTDDAVPDPAYSYSTKDFDDMSTDRHVMHRFDNLTPPDACISGAKFEFRAKAGSSNGPHSAGNDAFYFQASPDVPGLYGAHFGIETSSGTPSLLTSSAVPPPESLPSSGSAWGNNIPASLPETGVLFQLDLAALPIADGDTISIINELESNNYLNARVQDDTALDYFKLTVEYCTPPRPLTDGGNQWTMTAYQDSSPSHTELTEQSICFEYAGTQGTHEVYRWHSPTLPGWGGRAHIEGDQVFMHGDYGFNYNIKEQHTALQWELATDLDPNTRLTSKGWGHCVDWQHNGTEGSTNVFANIRFERNGQCREAVVDVADDDAVYFPGIVASQKAYACTQRKIIAKSVSTDQLEPAEAK